MPGRSIWKGSLTFGLVNIPISVHSMTKSERPHLNQVCSHDATPIQYKRWCPEEEREVPYNEINFGMQVGPEMITVSKQELETISAEKENAINIVQMVQLKEVPPIYFDHPYFLLPQDKLPKKSFVLFQDAIARSGRAALGTVVLRNKEHLVLVYPWNDLLIMDTIRYSQEIDRPEPPKIEAELSKQEKKLADQLLESLEGKFELDQFKDESTERLTTLLETKGTRGPIRAAPEAPGKKAKELVDVLKESVRARKRKLDAHDRKHGLAHARVPVEAV